MFFISLKLFYRDTIVFVWQYSWCWDEHTIPFGLRVPLLWIYGLILGVIVMLEYARAWHVYGWVECFLVESSLFSLRWVIWYMFIYYKFWYVCAHVYDFVVIYMVVGGNHEIWSIHRLDGYRWKHSYLVLFKFIWL